MLFHEQNEDLGQDLFDEFQVLCGIEEEFLIIEKGGSLAEIADDIMVKSAEILEKNSSLLNSLQLKIRGLDAEPSPSQIEYVTLPLPPSSIEQAVKEGRGLVIEAAKQIGAKILAQSLHPIQSDPNPISGTHINVSVQKKGAIMTPENIKAVHNYLWNYLPEIIAISANSPIYRGSFNNIASNRCANSHVLKRNGFAVIQIPENKPALVPMRYYGRMRYKLKIGYEKDEFSKKVITNNRGERLVDITPRGPFTNISDDNDELPSRNRVEIRIVDVQYNVEDLLDIAYLCCLSSLHAIYLNSYGEITKDPYHDENVEIAIGSGFNSEFKRSNGSKESLETTLSRWVEETSKYQDYLKVIIKNLPTKKLQGEQIQKNLDIDYNTRKIEKLRQQGRVQATIQLSDPRIVKDQNGRKYRIERNTQIRGTISAGYEFSYDERDGLVSKFKGIKVINYLTVQNISIPLKASDRIVKVQSESESLIDRLFGDIFF